MMPPNEERRTTLRQLTALLTDQRAKAPEAIAMPPPHVSPAPAAADPPRTDSPPPPTSTAITTPQPAADPTDAEVEAVIERWGQFDAYIKRSEVRAALEAAEPERPWRGSRAGLKCANVTAQ
jgi:hypothetical protein